jgi:hypothetical protein
MTRARLWCLWCVCLAAVPSLALAQAREGHLELGASVGLAGSHDLGSEKAIESGNGMPSGSPVTLFQASSSLERGATFEARVAWHLTRAFAVEGTLGVARTHVRTSVTNDFEQAPPAVATSRLTQYTVEVGALWALDGLRFGHGRVRPFVTGGGGYLRQLHAQATFVETGTSAFAGGGIKIKLHEAKRRPRPSFLKTVGVRADVRANFTHGGFDVDADAWRIYPSLTSGMYVCF